MSPELTASIADVKAHLSGYLNDDQHAPVVVTRNSKPVAVLLPINDDEEIERLLMAYLPRLQSLLKAARKRIQAGKGIANEEFWRAL